MSTTASPFPTLEGPSALPALQMVRTPRLARRLTRLLLAALVLLPLALLFVPWTQTVRGTGRTVAFNPVQRPQYIVSPIEGRIKKWYVVEGERVRAGQRIVEMVDNDPNLELRLLDEERAILDRLRAAEQRVQDIEARIRNLENSRQLAVAVQGSLLRQEEARLQAFRQERLEAKAALDAAEPNYRRQKGLFENRQGSLASKRDLELAAQSLGTAQAKFRQAEARVRLGEAAVKAAWDNLSKVEADTAAMINLETAGKRSAEADVASIRRDKAQIEVRIARQRAQYVDAPSDGTIFRLLAAGEAGGILVKPGERLAILVPDIKEGGEASPRPGPGQLVLALGTSLGAAAAPTGPAAGLAAQAPWLLAADQRGLTAGDHPGIVVELLINGNDLPLVRRGDRMRLQFEGWPAVQFVAWPQAAAGTFGGRVYLIDPTANDRGEFRILVEPDPDDRPWPAPEYLRQGVRAQGWVLLNQVSLGWELWRQLNGFPPVREDPALKDWPRGPIKGKGGK